MEDTRHTRIQLRRGSWEEWERADPTLAAGEPGVVVSGNHTGKIKIGDGETTWNRLPFVDEDKLSQVHIHPNELIEGDGTPENRLRVRRFAQELTHERLLEMIVEGALHPGQFYVITDFRTIYRQSGTGWAEGDVEPLVVLATSENTLDCKALSPIRPHDEIWYDVTQNNRERYAWAVENDRGQIYRRITGNGNDTPYDVRAVKFRRWPVGNQDCYDAERAYAKGNFVRHGDNIYMSTRDDNIGHVPGESSGAWHFLCSAEGLDRFIGTKSTGNGIVWDTELRCFEVVSGEHRDFYTFDNGNHENMVDTASVHNNKIGAVYNERGAAELNNSVFIGAGFHSNTFGNGFSANTFWGGDGSGSNSNTIGNDFRSNIVRDGFRSNAIGNDFSSNVTGASFRFVTAKAGVRQIIFPLEAPSMHDRDYGHTIENGNGAVFATWYELTRPLGDSPKGPNLRAMIIRHT